MVSQARPQAAGTPCNRECLEAWIDRYLDAVIAHDPSRVLIAQDAVFTENGQRLEVGDGLWATASARGSYHLCFVEPETGQVGAFETLRENGTPVILALRLKIAGNAIAEIETIVARDPEGAGRLEALGQPHPSFLTAVPIKERMSRDRLIAIGDMYFEGLERDDGQGVYPFTGDCNRLENGKQTTNNPLSHPDDGQPGAFSIDALGCKAQFETGFFAFVTRIRDRRFVLVDRERGLVFAFAFFDHAGNIPTVTLTNGMTIPIGVSRPWTWEIAELFKVERGLLRQIEAVLCESPYGMNSGWSTWEEGLSTRARSV